MPPTESLVMDQHEKQRFLETLRQDEQFRAEVRKEILIDELAELPKTVAQMATALSVTNAGVNALIDTSIETRRDIAEIGSVLKSVAEIVVTGFAEMRDGFAEMRDGFAATQNGFTAVDAKFDQVNAAIDELRGKKAS